MKIQVTLRINGKVQGVCYRAGAQQVAQKLGLTGYAQNNRDSSVTVVLYGEEVAVHQMIEWCKKGPRAARVENIEIHEEIEVGNATRTRDTFEIY
jgi:acylphosphatase